CTNVFKTPASSGSAESAVRRLTRAVLTSWLASGQTSERFSFCPSTWPTKSTPRRVFLTNQRFETSKRKLGFLSFNDFAHCANQMIAHCARRLKRFAANWLRNLQLAPLSQTAMADFEAGHKQLPAAGLTQLALQPDNRSNGTRDFFLDTVEQLVEPWVSGRLDFATMLSSFWPPTGAAAKETSTLIARDKSETEDLGPDAGAHVCLHCEDLCQLPELPGRPEFHSPLGKLLSACGLCFVPRGIFLFRGTQLQFS
uniref:HECT domain-containing protein n=1 Tax=Macrostomum lignano TaxID=282301 RepID=A0A1I8FEJ1_9PLAT